MIKKEVKYIFSKEHTILSKISVEIFKNNKFLVLEQEFWERL